MESLSDRQRLILKLIVAEYIASAVPVGSAMLTAKYSLAMSPATTRNEMAELEAAGFIAHPHTSAGRVPTTKGYRYFVECLMEEGDLTPEQQDAVRRHLQQAGLEPERWLEVAASTLAQVAQNAALVTLPRPRRCILKQLEVISVHERLLLIIVALADGTVQRRLLIPDRPVAPDEAQRITNYLNALLSGSTLYDLTRRATTTSGLARDVANTAAELLREVDARAFEEIRYAGIEHVLRQPEFARAERVRDLVSLLHERRHLAQVLTEASATGEVRIIIGGDEQAPDALRDWSIVLAPYGKGGPVGGVLGVLGPTRMEYPRVVSGVRYVVRVMNDLFQDLYQRV
jgi:heat-inducible transcriptional repressor